MPEQLDTKILPLLPLTTGVVLPTMVVTVTLETEEARAAVNAARSADDTLLLVPRSEDGHYARDHKGPVAEWRSRNLQWDGCVKAGTSVSESIVDTVRGHSDSPSATWVEG